MLCSIERGWGFGRRGLRTVGSMALLDQRVDPVYFPARKHEEGKDGVTEQWTDGNGSGAVVHDR